ncbi:MAG: metal ABC transporter permease [Rhodospirillales bacterium]|nr:metal ABC transporter permease [Rhodospirillales bacterium]
MLDDFFIRAVLAGIGVAVVAGPLGCFIIWRRIAYVGDAMAHSALLGVALGLFLDINLTAGVVVVTTTIAVALVALQQRQWLSSDALLGILSHASLSLGLVAIGLMAWLRLDLMGYLFGDILAVTPADLAWIYGGGVLVVAALVAIWRPLLAATVHQDLAQAEGVPVGRVQVIFMVLIALIIAMAMKLVGIILVTALLIIPAAAARPFAATPERMAVLAALIGAAAAVLGLYASLYLDTPSGPSIVLVAAVLFGLSLIPIPGRRSRS